MDVLEKFGLHDTQINNIFIHDKGLTLDFKEGIYQLKNNKEDILTRPCRLEIEIMNFSPKNLYEHIEIVAFRKNRFREITLLNFIKRLETYCYDIIDVLYSSFSKTILFKGFFGKSKIEFFVSEVNNIEMQFQVE